MVRGPSNTPPFFSLIAKTSWKDDKSRWLSHILRLRGRRERDLRLIRRHSTTREPTSFGAYKAPQDVVHGANGHDGQDVGEGESRCVRQDADGEKDVHHAQWVREE